MFFFISRKQGVWRYGLAYPTLFAVLMACVGPIAAQSGVPDSIMLRTVVIQSTRAGSDAPVPHTNFSAAKTRQNNLAQDVPFLLSGAPSLVESSDAGNGVGYTGLRIRGSDPTRINVTLNGIPLNDAESQGLFWVDLPDIATSASEIQIQRGVGTSTNGAGAFGATVNIDLSRVEADPFAQVNTALGSFNTRKISAMAGTGLLNGRFAFNGRVSHLKSDGFIDRASANLNSTHLTGSYLDDRQSVQVHFLSGHEVTYQAWNGVPAQYVDIDSLRTFNTAGIEQPGTPYPDEVDDYTQRHLFFHYKKIMGHGLDLQWNAHYTRGFGFYEQYRSGEILSEYKMSPLILADTTLDVSDLVRRRWLDNHFYGSTFVLRWTPPVNPPRLAGPPTVMLGGALSRYDGQHYGEVIWAQLATAPSTRYYDNDAHKTDGNVFLKSEVNLSNGWGVFLDLQYRAVSYRFLGFDAGQNNVEQQAMLHFFNPKAGVNWKINRNWTAYGFFGVGNREPNRDDYTQSTPASRPRSERLYDWELGVKSRNSARQSIAVNLFYMLYYNQLVLDGRLNDVGAYIRTNVKSSYRAGIEIEGALRPVRLLNLNANLALSTNKIKDFVEYRDNWDTGLQDQFVYQNTSLAFSPSIVARGEAVFHLFSNEDRNALNLSLSGKYVSKQYLDNTSSESAALPSYFFTDLRINYDLTLKSGNTMGFILSVYNLANARYSSNGWIYRYTSAFDNRPYDPYTRLEKGNVYNQTGYFPQAGRNWMLGLNLGF